MKNHPPFKLHIIALGLVCIVGISCNPGLHTVSNRLAESDKKMVNYEDSTLSQTTSPYLLPFNRIIDGAGTVITFGNGELENHSLDAVLLPDKNEIAVEDRYGVSFIDLKAQKEIFHLGYDEKNSSRRTMSVYSGIKMMAIDGMAHVFWTAADPDSKKSYLFEAVWDGKKASIVNAVVFAAVTPAPLALPNDIALQQEGTALYVYVVLNGNNQLAKVRMGDKKIIWQIPTGMAAYGIAIVDNKAYVSNWGGTVPVDPSMETAGIPYAKVYTSKVTGATSSGSVSVIDIKNGQLIKEIPTGMHPNAVVASKDGKYIYMANGNSDNVSVIRTDLDAVVETISVKLNGVSDDLPGDSPNALCVSEDGKTLYVANGMDNAVAVIQLDTQFKKNSTPKSKVLGFIPTQAYPGGLVLNGHQLIVTNLEGTGARVKKKNAFNSHHQEATISLIDVPDATALAAYTVKVKQLNMEVRNTMLQLLPRKNRPAVPIPERIGEPSSIKHVIYIIKENRTYDQVLGDMPEGRGDKSLCVFGDSVTPNEHAIARQFGLLDNYYASGKSSAEGHQWTDAAMVTDYVEKNVRAWFRSYPHVQQDALVYDIAGFIWNNALDHGKKVRIYGEACEPVYDSKLHWADIYSLYSQHLPFTFENRTTISRVEPILSKTYPCYDNHSINDQFRADDFIKELEQNAQSSVDTLPDLMILALPNDHTTGMRPGFPTPRASVADNDLALGRIIDAVTHSRFWDSTAVFVTEDDSQDGWDHISAYRTTGFVISPYSLAQQVIHTNYNQTSIVRTIEQILGIPPMNKVDATASPMFSCFQKIPVAQPFQFLANRIPLNEMNKPATAVKGKEKKFTLLSMQSQFDHIDGGNDDLMNRIIWYSTMGNVKYPVRMTLGLKDTD